ncbi:hypothetical protein K1719_009366 [Acacia pycnantha]|nr:hypothetical protein K1719_009366 [Acacia pycnantha]
MFIHRWLPLFYVPSLVVLPLSIKDIPAASGIKIGFIIVGGWLATLCVAGFTALAIRKAVKTEMMDAESMEKPSPFSSYSIWKHLELMLERAFHSYLLPMCWATCLVLGFHQLGFEPVLGYYLTNASSNPGAGDILNAFLDYVILSFAFSMFKQRKLIKRHAAEIFTSVIVSAVSIILIVLNCSCWPSSWLIKRHAAEIFTSVIVSAVSTLYHFFKVAISSLTAAVVVVTGLVGANFAQTTLDKLHFRDPIARGIATASSILAIFLFSSQCTLAYLHVVKLLNCDGAHGLRTATLSTNEPEALPFCAIAYALNGIFGTTLFSIPPVRESLLAIVG